MRASHSGSFTLALATAMLTLGLFNPGHARDHIRIVGSSTVYPFAVAVADAHAKAGGLKAPKIESTGTGGGFKLFCAGIGEAHPDIADASRAINPEEAAACKANGVTEIVEVKIGYDGIALANSKWAPQLKTTPREIYLALAKEIPDPATGDKMIANPHKTWRDINPKFPKSRIEVIGPPSTSGTRDAFVELVMEAGCKQFPQMQALAKVDPKAFKQLCHTLRVDGAYVEAGENDNEIVQKLLANPKLFGIFGFSFLNASKDRLQGAAINGVTPSFDTIADSRYPVSRPLFIYVKKAHLDSVPGLAGFVAEFTSEAAWGEGGYLAKRGLIPLSDLERRAYAGLARKMEPMR